MARRTFEIDVPCAPGAGVQAAGIDLTDVDRLGLALHRSGPALLARVCGPGERAAIAQLASPLLPWALALAFGLFEATVKAAGGMPPGGRFHDVDAAALLTTLDTPVTVPADLSGSPAGIRGAITVRGELARQLRFPDTDHVLAGVHRVGPHLLLCWVFVAGEHR